MITLYTLERGRGDRIMWILRLLELEYTEELFGRDPKTGRGCKELKEVHPSGRVPILRDGDLIIAESGLIIEYLVEKYGKGTEFEPKSEEERMHIRYGIMASEANIMTAGFQLFTNFNAIQKMPWGMSFVAGKILAMVEAGYARPEMEACLDNLRDTINANGGYYSNGHLSGADVMYNLILQMISRVPIVPDFEHRWPDLSAYHKRFKQRVDAAPAAKVTLIDHRERGAGV